MSLVIWEKICRKAGDMGILNPRKPGGRCDMPAERDFFTVDDVARLLKVTPETVIRWTQEGLPYLYRGGRYLFVKENVFEWAGQHVLNSSKS